MTKQMVRTYIDSVTQERDELKKQNAELLKLIGELAPDGDGFYADDNGWLICGKCGAQKNEQHSETCPWVRARKLLDNISDKNEDKEPDKLVDQQR